MAQNSKITWTDHTFNPWLGCHKVTDACKFCYAEKFVTRYGLASWGANGTRHITSDANWKKPLQWQKQALKEGKRFRVFCASLADVFEDRPDLLEARQRLWSLIEATPNLDWILVSKRAQNYETMFPERWLPGGGVFPRNIWLLATIANQKDYDAFMPPLRKFCTNHFVSVMGISAEPLLGYITFDKNITLNTDEHGKYLKPLDWVIIGGESGPTTKIRKLDLYHVKHIFDQFKKSRNIYSVELRKPNIFFKQLGALLAKQYKLQDVKGEGVEEFPEPVKKWSVREFPFVSAYTAEELRKRIHQIDNMPFPERSYRYAHRTQFMNKLVALGKSLYD